jgi:hypothetical protein
MTKDIADFRREYPNSLEVVHVFDALMAVLDAEEDMDLAEHPRDGKPPASPARVEELRYRLRQAAQGARVQLAMLKDEPAPTTPKSLHPPGTQHAGSSRHG